MCFKQFVCDLNRSNTTFYTLTENEVKNRTLHVANRDVWQSLIGKNVTLKSLGKSWFSSIG